MQAECPELRHERGAAHGGKIGLQRTNGVEGGQEPLARRRHLPGEGDFGAEFAAPLPVPSTAIYSRTDGIVAWRSCLEDEGPLRENVAIACSHTGMGFHPAALEVVADRLALPEGAWAPYRGDASAGARAAKRNGRAAAGP